MSRVQPVVHPGVRLGPGCVLEEYVVVGVRPQGAPEDLATEIGPGARIRSHTVVYAGNRVGARFQTGHGALLREMNVVGDDVSVGTHSIVEHRVRIGDRVRIHSNVFVPEFTVLEDDCWIGPCAVLTNAQYPRGRGVKESLRGAHVEAGAKVGAGATLLPGVRIGRDALVGAGAVVVRDVPAGKVVVGNPARVVKDVRDIPAYREPAVLGGGAP